MIEQCSRVTVYCRYFNGSRHEIGAPFETQIFPDTIAYCSRRFRAKYMSLTLTEDEIPQPPVKIIDRKMANPHHNFTVCMAPLYGDEPKWLQIAEFMEHYKLQGATMVYIWVGWVEDYTKRILEDYEKRGEAEIFWLYDQYPKNDYYWHNVEIQGCFLHTKRISKWTAVVDLDERLILADHTRPLIGYMNHLYRPDIATLIFRQQYIIKTESSPEYYIDDRQTEEFMPTQRYHNSSSFGPPMFVTKSIVQMDKVAVLSIHKVLRYYGYYTDHQLTPEEGYVKHYRYVKTNNFTKFRLSQVEKLGEFSVTSLEPSYSKKLVDNTVNRVRHVYKNI
ncbi:unnamed protein product [Caenorhabditis bovis]|uniref:Glycosyltransferase family 92 protein n=1 Tax=Caenorhabditis bovis TaxID=2654633 RepID=A0A8S1F1L7_9PELO|nr:unnamed protein product [Caenorhabditis bovis]